jgi:hypothetical protein
MDSVTVALLCSMCGDKKWIELASNLGNVPKQWEARPDQTLACICRPCSYKEEADTFRESAAEEPQ